MIGTFVSKSAIRVWKIVATCTYMLINKLNLGLHIINEYRFFKRSEKCTGMLIRLESRAGYALKILRAHLIIHKKYLLCILCLMIWILCRIFQLIIIYSFKMKWELILLIFLYIIQLWQCFPSILGLLCRVWFAFQWKNRHSIRHYNFGPRDIFHPDLFDY